MSHTILRATRLFVLIHCAIALANLWETFPHPYLADKQRLAGDCFSSFFLSQLPRPSSPPPFFPPPMNDTVFIMIMKSRTVCCCRPCHKRETCEHRLDGLILACYQRKNGDRATTDWRWWTAHLLLNHSFFILGCRFVWRWWYDGIRCSLCYPGPRSHRAACHHVLLLFSQWKVKVQDFFGGKRGGVGKFPASFSCL